jgi:oxygen-independent coproporphyrinogen-3 oxidase
VNLNAAKTEILGSVPAGIYISVPFCKTKCSYCNFASGVFSRQVFAKYVERVVEDIANSEGATRAIGGEFERVVDSIYLGGGTPTLLEPAQLSRLFTAVRERFEVKTDAEVTVECAPGTLTPEVVETLVGCGVNRVSLGVQSFIDREASSVARLHSRAVTLDDISRLRAAGIENISIDLIAGLPHQTAESWEESLRETIDSGVPHASVYMLEVDEDSRLGRELIAGGTKYHAHHVPDEDLTADLYEHACERFEEAGLRQYEISNFARKGWESKHNLKYWRRDPYFGFGVDAHSMFKAAPGAGLDAVRVASSENLEQYVSGAPQTRTPVSHAEALEEAFFLGLRLVRGVDLTEMAERYGPEATIVFREQMAEMSEAGLVEVEEGCVRLTARGRLLSNEVFGRLIQSSLRDSDSVDAAPGTKAPGY